ncbi:SDR family oxidoreductase [Nocardia tengchongensis]|uniref:SDR family oxidoreductase n=1 Tax=Nocardia tengchongensis TaxID=2055889 RepID=UPI0036ACD9D8
MTWRKQTVLLTGGSGVLGRALIDELAHDFDVVCLRHRTPVGDMRVSEFAGGFSDPRLGLTTADYRVMVNRVDAIVHSAAATNWTAAPSDIRATNLEGPTALLRLAEDAGVPLYFFSTAFVANPPADTSFPGAAAYVDSKIEAEQLVREHSADTVIVRPSVVVGDSETGHMVTFQGLHRVLGALVRGSVPILPCQPEAPIDTIPQDVVAGVIGKMLRESIVSGEYWLTAGANALTAADLMEICHEVAAEAGLEQITPRYMPGEAVERLLLPLLEDSLPPKMRQMFREFLEFTWLFQTDDVFPSSLAELGFDAQVTRSALRSACRNSLQYWARKKGILLDSRELVA